MNEDQEFIAKILRGEVETLTAQWEMARAGLRLDLESGRHIWAGEVQEIGARLSALRIACTKISNEYWKKNSNFDQCEFLRACGYLRGKL